jgi:hypothetical protein
VKTVIFVEKIVNQKEPFLEEVVGRKLAIRELHVLNEREGSILKSLWEKNFKLTYNHFYSIIDQRLLIVGLFADSHQHLDVVGLQIL